VKAGDIQLQLAASNLWWRNPEWTSEDPNLRRARAASFNYRAGSLRGLAPGGLYLLRGPRRAGKSTEVKYAVADLLAAGVPPRNVVHAAVDGWRDIDLRTMIAGASRTFLAGTTGTRYWFLDEITSVTGDWPNVLKNLRDNDAAFADDTVVLTGSSSARLHEVRKAIAGRRGQVSNLDRVLLPMSFGDFVAAAGVSLPALGPTRARDLREKAVRAKVDALLPFIADLVPLWETYLRIGGFPQAVSAWRTTGDLDRPIIDAIWDVVYGDAIADARLSAAQTLTLLSRLVVNLCSPLNMSGLARDIDVSQATARQRLADLTEAFLVWPCHQEQGLLPKLNAQSKWYFVDPLIARLAALRGFGREPDLTQLSEQQLGMALLRSVGAGAATEIADYDAVLCYRSATNAEIDFVGRPLGVAVESKYADDISGRVAQTIRASNWKGIVGSRSVLEWGDHVDVMPTALMVLLLGC
jgi:predicted AAA+ superfamily ATPase